MHLKHISKDLRKGVLSQMYAEHPEYKSVEERQPP